MELTSTVFENDQPIPKRHSKEGENISPPLAWNGVPLGARELVLLCEDPDAPKRPNQDHPFIHWVAYHIPHDTVSLPEGITTVEPTKLPPGAVQGMNSSGEEGYMGPMPPVGHGTHRYFFKLFAVDVKLQLPPRLTWRKVEDAMQGHILETAELLGTYVRDSE